MRWQLASTFAVTAMSAGCYSPGTLDCKNGYLCPEGLACAEPGVCGEPALVDACRVEPGVDQFKADFEGCEQSGTSANVCLGGVCTPCTNELAGCTFAAWTPMASPLSSELQAVFALAPTTDDPAPHAYAGGSEGVLIEWDGRTWEPSSTFVASTLEIKGIWASSQDDVYVLQSPKLWHWDGSVWTDVASMLPAAVGGVLHDIDGTSSTNVIVVSDDGAIIKWDGSTWTAVFGPPGPLFQGVIATDPAIAVGSSGYVFVGPDGTQIASAMTVQFTEVAKTSDAAIIVGEKVENAPKPTIYEMTGSQVVAATFDDSIPIAYTLNAAWAANSAAYAAGEEGKILTRGADKTWREAVQVPGRVNSIGGPDERHLLAVGANGLIYRFTPP